MEAFLALTAILSGLVLLDGLAVRFGVDSTDGSTDPRSSLRGALA